MSSTTQKMALAIRELPDDVLAAIVRGGIDDRSLVTLFAAALPIVAKLDHGPTYPICAHGCPNDDLRARLSAMGELSLEVLSTHREAIDQWSAAYGLAKEAISRLPVAEQSHNKAVSKPKTDSKTAVDYSRGTGPGAPNGTAAAVLAAIRDNPGASRRELERAVEIRTKTGMTKALRRLRMQGHIRREGCTSDSRYYPIIWLVVG